MPTNQRKRSFQLFRKMKFCSSFEDDESCLDFDKMMLHTLDCLGALSILLESHCEARSKIFWHSVVTIAELGSDAMTGERNKRHPGAGALIRAFPSDQKVTDSGGWLPLHWAAVCDNVTSDEIKSIAKADPLAAVKGSNQPISSNPGHLIAASRHPDMKVVRTLFGFYPRMAFTRDRDGDLPLHYAARYTQSVEMITYLLQLNPSATKAQGSSGMVPLHCALNNENVESRLSIVSNLVSVDKESILMADLKGNSTLHLAVSFTCDKRLVELLVNANSSSICAKNYAGELPLHTACYFDHFEEAEDPTAVVKLLINRYHSGAAIPNIKGAYPAHIAAEFSVTSVVKEVFYAFPPALSLLSPGIGTPLHFAVTGNKLDTVNFIINEYPEVVRIPDSNGVLPFHLASGKDNIDILKALYYAYPEAAKTFTKFGKLPLHIFAIEEFDDQIQEQDKTADILRFLLKVYPDAADTPDMSGETPLNLLPKKATFARRLFLLAKPNHNPSELFELNYSQRRMAMFLTFSAINANGIPTIWTKLRLADLRLLIHTVSYL